MNSKGIGLIIIIIVIITGLTFLFNQAFSGGAHVVEPVQPVVDATDTSSGDETISVARTYVSGIHTYVGEINLPTPCHELLHTVMIAESYPEQVAINFLTQTETAMCAEYITPEPFAVSFQASKDATVTMTLNGEKLPYKIISTDVRGTAEDESEEIEDELVSSEEEPETE